MLISLKNGNEIDLGIPIDISIPLRFEGDQPNAYGVERAKSSPVATGSLVGDTRRGGSCNFEQITLIPHCNGTHTECIGHITHERISVRDCLRDTLIPALLVSVEPVDANQSGESYAANFGDADLLITKRILEEAILRANKSAPPTPLLPEEGWPRLCEAGVAGEAGGFLLGVDCDGRREEIALVIRTLPNDQEKLSRVYDSHVPPYFSTDAMECIVGLGVKHLLVDLPSIDRLYDGGKLSNHRIFWHVEQGEFELNQDSRKEATITELIYVPDAIPDSPYLLNLQIAPFASDASPSRPLLFKV